MPVVAWALVTGLARPSPWRAARAGLLVGLSLFTYPGVLVGYAAIALGWTMAALVEVLRSRRPAEAARPLARVPARSWLAFAAPLAAVLALGALLHARVYAHTHGLFHGGGSFDLSGAGLRASLPVVLRDAFVHTGSWHLLYPEAPFVDWTWWPLAALGAWCVWRRAPSWIGRGLVLSIPLVLLVAAMCGAYPGMRRGLYILFPLAACAGLGADAVFARAGAGPGTVIVLLAVAHPVFYQATIGRRTWDLAVLGQSFGSRPLPDDALLAALEQHDVVLSTDEFPNAWDRNRHLHYWRLALRHHALRRPHALLFARGSDPAAMAELERSPDAALLTWAPERFLPSLARAGGLCFDRSHLEERPALVRLAPAERAAAGELCLYRGGRSSALTSCVRPGQRHHLSKLVHDVVCDGAYCDESRPDSVYVEPGSIAFRLRRPGPPSEPVDVVVHVSVLPPWERENRVVVNGQDIGALGRAGPDPNAELRIAVPPEARTESEAWSVTLGPSGRPGRVGWDVVWVALARGGRRPPGARTAEEETCPALTCADTGDGRTCEDAAGQSRSSS